MNEFSADESRRWDAWQQANARSTRRSDLICRACAVGMFAITLGALAVALLQR